MPPACSPSAVRPRALPCSPLPNNRQRPKLLSFLLLQSKAAASPLSRRSPNSRRTHLSPPQPQTTFPPPVLLLLSAITAPPPSPPLFSSAPSSTPLLLPSTITANSHHCSHLPRTAVKPPISYSSTTPYPRPPHRPRSVTAASSSRHRPPRHRPVRTPRRRSVHRCQTSSSFVNSSFKLVVCWCMVDPAAEDAQFVYDLETDVVDLQLSQWLDYQPFYTPVGYVERVTLHIVDSVESRLGISS